jgi:hypothetical protein
MMNIKRVIGCAIAVLVIGSGAQIVGITAASADASGAASCVGLESSSIAPAGSNDEFPGGRSELERVLHELAHEFGVTSGAIVSSVAHLHAGSHAQCDEATG